MLPILSGTAHSQEAMPGSIYKNSIGMEFVPVLAGKFLMGFPDSDHEARAFEKPQHEVTISRLFYLSRFEVTQAHGNQ